MFKSAKAAQHLEESRPEIGRTTLRKLLLDAVPSDSVEEGHTLVSARPVGNSGRHELVFANGITTVCDVLVGADGGNLRVRPLVSSITPTYSGMTGAEVSLAPEVVARPDMQDVREAVCRGSMFAPHDCKVLGSQLNGDVRILTYASFRGPQD